MAEVPLVSIFAVTYNQEQYVDDMLDGVFAQDYPNLEIVISDDNSTDATWEIVTARVEAYVKDRGLHRVIINRNSRNLGIIGNVEKAIELSHGELLVAQGGDDISLPNRVSAIVAAWEEQGRKPYAIAHGFTLIGNCRNILSEKLLFAHSERTPVGAAMAYRREVFDCFPRVSYPMVTEDHVYVRRALILGGVMSMAEQLVQYRRGAGVSSQPSYSKRRLKVSQGGFYASLQTFKDLQVYTRPSGTRQTAVAIAVDLLNFYAREYFAFGGAATKRERRLAFDLLEQNDPLSKFSYAFWVKRMACLYPSWLNYYGRRTILPFKLTVDYLPRKLRSSKVFGVVLKPLYQKYWLKKNRLKCTRTLARLKMRQISSARPIRVAYLQLFASSNQNFSIFERMQKDSRFDPYFIVYPDYQRGKEFSDENYAKTICFMRERFGEDRVLLARDEYGQYHDYSSKFDMFTTSNPYDGLAHPCCRVDHWTACGVPSFYMSYFYLGRCYVTKWNLKMLTLSCFTRFYVENKAVLDAAHDYQIIRGKNCLLTGSAKMDDYEKCVPATHSRKRVLVAPHHAIEAVWNASGAFLRFADDFPKLVQEYPDIDFVFRPHPLLFQKLSGVTPCKGLEPWGRECLNDYLANLKAQPNVIFSEGGDYLQEFADSDALIHDCGSFAAEYLYTNKPCAFMWRPNLRLDAVYTPLGQKSVNAHYIIRDEREVREFLDKVVIAENDTRRTFRGVLAKEEFMYNYPHASDCIFEDIKGMLGLK